MPAFGRCGGPARFVVGEGREHLGDHFDVVGDLEFFFGLEVRQVLLEERLLPVVVAVPICRGEAIVRAAHRANFLP